MKHGAGFELQKLFELFLAWEFCVRLKKTRGVSTVLTPGHTLVGLHEGSHGLLSATVIGGAVHTHPRLQGAHRAVHHQLLLVAGLQGLMLFYSALTYENSYYMNYLLKMMIMMIFHRKLLNCKRLAGPKMLGFIGDLPRITG